MSTLGYILVLMAVVCGGHCLVKAVLAMLRSRRHPNDTGDESGDDNKKGCH